MNKYPSVAIETPGCPPHRWYIEIDSKGRDGMGYCIKPGCKAVKDFSSDGHRTDEKGENN